MLADNKKCSARQAKHSAAARFLSPVSTFWHEDEFPGTDILGKSVEINREWHEFSRFKRPQCHRRRRYAFGAASGSAALQPYDEDHQQNKPGTANEPGKMRLPVDARREQGDGDVQADVDCEERGRQSGALGHPEHE